MLKNILKFLDKFLPEQFIEVVDAPLLYRGRIIVGTNLVALIIMLTFGALSLVLDLSMTLKISAFVTIITVLSLLYFFKNQTNNYEKNFLIGAILQIVLISLFIYISSFTAHGIGFFGLLRLIPVFLMIAFYFNTRFSLYFAISNFLIFLVVTIYEYERLLEPFHSMPDFPKVFVILISLIIVFAYLLAFLFVHLSEGLQREVIKQRDLLAESAKFQSLGQMASNLAHDINNPLFTIQGKLHQIRNLLSRDQLDLEKCDQIVESAELTILRLSQIVKGISTFAREGRADQMVSIGLAELIGNTLVFATDRITNLGIKLDIQIDQKAKLICYPSFISQIILNLLNNAIDALENSDVKLIEVRAFREKNLINITISDNGEGVPKEIEKKIFDPFFTTKTFGKGTGLGLSISKGLVEVHEGELTYERVANKSQFIIRLPSYE